MLGKKPLGFIHNKDSQGIGPSQFRNRQIDVPCIDLSLVDSSFSSNILLKDSKDTKSEAGDAKKPRKGKEGKATSSFILHQVSMSDTFMGLAIRYEISADEIRKANGLMSGTQLCSLFEIKIPVHAKNGDDEAAASVKSKSESTKLKKKKVQNTATSVEDWLAEQVNDREEEDRKPPAPNPNDMNPKCKSFFDKFDSKMSELKTTLGKTMRSPTKNQSQASGVYNNNNVEPQLLNGALMSTTKGREIAEDRALSQIERILCLDDDEITSMREDYYVPPKKRTEEEADNENDLNRDVDVYAL
eukprot:m.55116 g.55116  ORF g.55116 m.55116 type:complete len:301 (+) comp22024_c0_seq2:455-1357(+)